MHGSYRIRVRNSKNSYSFELRRNITLLRGESGRGKTTLFDMLRDHNRYGKQSGVTVSCDREIFALDGDSWEETLHKHTGEIIVVDEDSQFIRSENFARAVKGSDNYFLLITRDYLPNLPVSVDEIYELTGKKNKRFKPIYKEVNRMYDNPSRRYLLPVEP